MAKGGKGKGKGSKVEICAVGDKDCLRPEGTVVWVFCDACDGWFHCVCVNVDGKKATDEDFIFICKCCKPRKEKVRILKMPCKMVGFHHVYKLPKKFGLTGLFSV